MTVDFPVLDGRRPSTPTVRGVLADAVRGVDPQLAEDVLATPSWRADYVDLVRRATECSASSAQAAVRIAREGLASLHRRMVLRGPEGDRPLATAAPPPQARAASATVHGEGRRVPELHLPYRGRVLTGRELSGQLDRWVAGGTVEPSCAEAVRQVQAHPEWLALPGRRVALLGAGAELSPLLPLTSWGADVLAVDLPLPAVQARLRSVSRTGAGRVTVPVRGAGSSGIDLVAEAPEVIAWLRGHAEAGLVLASTAYAPGSQHLRVNAAVDLVASRLAEEPGVVVASTATPTDAFVVPAEVVDAALAAQAGSRRWAAGALHRLSGGRVMAPSYPSRLPDGRGIADGLVPQQGPGYALAKRVQRWRAVSEEAAGRRVSVNVAPASRTASVTGNRLLAAAYAGAPLVGLEVFAPDTCRVLMAALLVHDLHAPPAQRRHPEDLFSSGAAHGGLWRAAYQPRSVLGLAAVAGAVPALVTGPRQRARPRSHRD